MSREVRLVRNDNGHIYNVKNFYSNKLGGNTVPAEVAFTANPNPIMVDAVGTDLHTFLHGRRAKEAIKPLEDAVYHLGTESTASTWEYSYEPTKGNVGNRLLILLNWAREHPKGIFQVL